MYTWLMDFNLRGTGEEVERFLVTMIREWPGRYEKLPGVLGVAFFGNAYGLAGSYSFRMVLDMKSLDTLSEVDRMYKTDANAKRAMNDFRSTRSELSSRLLKQGHSGDVISVSVNRAPKPALVYSFGAPATVSTESLRSAELGGSSSMVYQPLVRSEGSHGSEVWTSVPDVGRVEQVASAAARVGSITSHLHASFRIVDGALVAAA